MKKKNKENFSENNFNILEEFVNNKFIDKIEVLLEPIDKFISQLEQNIENDREAILDAIKTGQNYCANARHLSQKMEDICKNFAEKSISFQEYEETMISIIMWNNDIYVSKYTIQKLNEIKEKIINILKESK